MADLISRPRHLSNTVAEWADHSAIVPRKGEIAIEWDPTTPKLKVGDGSLTWALLPYIGGDGGGEGTPGPVGPEGPQGEAGPAGPPGATGATGADGIDGADSTVPGPPGATGPTGPPGTTSWTGITDKPSTFPPDPESVDDRVAALLVAGANVGIVYNDTANTITISSSAAGGGGGTVTSVSVATVNGFAGTVVSPTISPAISMSTTVTGMLKGNGTALLAAVAGTDYAAAIHNHDAAYAPLVHTHTASQITDFAEATDDRVAALLVAGTNITLNYNDAGNVLTIAGTAPAGMGSVTSVSVVSANGLAGSVATATTTPAITLSTSVSGMLKGSASAIVAAVAGTDYAAVSHTHAIYEQTANKGAASGYAPLDAGSKVPAIYLPAYVDDVLEFANLAAFPGTGSAGVIYVALDTGKIYRWSGSAYVEISPSPGSTDAVPEGATNLYFTNERVDDRVAGLLVAGANVSLTYNDAANTLTVAATGLTVGTVTSVSVVSANGLAGTVASATTTPAITLTTTVTGMLKGNGTAISAAVAGTDYVTPGGLTTALGAYLPLTGGTITIDSVGATLPNGITLLDSSSSSGWLIDVIGAGITFSSSDGSGIGAGVRLRFGQGMLSATGAGSNFIWEGAPTTAGTLVKLMTLTSGGVLTLTGTLNGTQAVFTSNITTSGGNLIVDRTGDAASATAYLRADAGFYALTYYQTGSSSRWWMGKNNAAESGSNAGSDFSLSAYADDGTTAVGEVFRAYRATRVVNFSVSPTAPTPATADDSTRLATTAFVKDQNYLTTAIVDISDTAPLTPATGQLWFYSGSAPNGANLYIRYNDGTSTQWVPAAAAGPEGPMGPIGAQGPTGATGATGATGGGVASVAVAPANGFGGSVATPTTTPVISLTTSIIGMLKGLGGALTLAVEGTDYLRGVNPAFTGTMYGPQIIIDGDIWTTGGDLRVDRRGDAANASVILQVDDQKTAQTLYYTGSTVRWALGKTADIEAGGAANDGSNFILFAYDDAGASLGTVFIADRATRVLTFGQTPFAPPPIAGATGNEVVNAAWVLAKGYSTGAGGPFLPLTGGTLTGALTGTTVTFTAVGTTGTVADVALISRTAFSATGTGARLYLSGSNNTSRAVYIEGVNTTGAGGGHDLVFGTNASTAAPIERVRISNAGATTVTGTLSATSDISSSANIYAGSGNAFRWTSRSMMLSASDGVVRMTNNAQTDFGRLQLGGTTSAFPAIKRNLTALNFRLADDSADAPITAAAGTFNGDLTTAGGIISTSGGNVYCDRTGDAVAAYLVVRADNSITANVAFATTDKNRWVLGKNATTETGSGSVGSDFQLFAYQDDGLTGIGTAFIVNRASRIMAFTVGATVPTPGAVTSTEVINAAWVLAKGYTASTGTVTSTSVVSANGLAGTVANATTTPAITLSTTISGMLKGNATAISAAVAETDYVSPSGLTTTLGNYLPLAGGTVTGDLRVNGKISMGAGALAGAHVYINKPQTGAATYYSVYSTGTVQTDVTSYAGFVNTGYTVASVFTLAAMRHFFAVQGTFGAGSVVTSQAGFTADASMIDGVSNYGFVGNIPAATGRWNFYAGGNANNAFAGNTRFGGVTAPAVAVDVTGAVAATGNISTTSNMYVGAAQAFYWLSRSMLISSADGLIRLSNNAQTDFSRLQFGGTAATFPAIKRNLTALNFRLADDTGDAPITAAAGTFSGVLTGGSFSTAGEIRTTGSNILTTGGNIYISRTSDAAAASLVMEVDDGFAASMVFTTAGSNRWLLGKNAGVEAAGGTNDGSDFTLYAYNDGGTGIGTVFIVTRADRVTTYSAPVVTAASIAGAAGLRIPHGAAPTTPVNGDMWTTSAGVFIRINGVTKTFTTT